MSPPLLSNAYSHSTVRSRVREVHLRPKLNERGETLADVIKTRRKHLTEQFGETFEDWPQASFAGVRSIAEIILRCRQIYRESTRATSTLGA